MKNDRGITMLMMVVTVVMMALIAVFSITNSRETVVETRIVKAYNEIREVKASIMSYAITEDLGNLSTYAISDLTSYEGISSKYPSSEQELYYLDFTTDSGFLCDLFEIANIEHDYIVNLKHLEDIEIFVVGGIEIKGTRYYTDQDIIEQYNDVFVGR